MSLTSNKVNLNNIIAKVYRDLGIDEEYDAIDLIEWGVEALRFVNAYEQYETKSEHLHIKNYRAELPCDLVSILELEYKGIQLDKGSGERIYDNLRGNAITKPYSYNLNVMDSLPLKLGKVYHLTGSDNFIIEQTYIKTNFKEGEVNIKYKSLPVDDDGIPLIPDDESFRAAIFWYIAWKYFFKACIKDQNLKWFYQDAEIKWYKYCKQAGAKAMMPDIFTLENIKRNYLSLLPKVNSYKVFFNDLNQ